MLSLWGFFFPPLQSYSPRVSRVIGCFKAMWWTLTHTFVAPFSNSLRGNLH